MPRRPEPWFRAQVGEYYVTIRGKQYRLGPDKGKAYQEFHELMTQQQPEILTGTVAEVIERYMNWVEKNRPKSYQLVPEADRALLPLDQMPPDPEAETAPHSRRAGQARLVRSVQGRMRHRRETGIQLGGRAGYVDRNPLRGLKKPDPGHREQTLTQQEFDTALSHVPNQNFRDIAPFVWHSGCRPEEVVKITPDMVDLQNSRVIIPRPDAKKKKRPRIIYLCPEARAIVERNMSNSPTLFLNTKGRPWTAFAIACTWGRIEKKTGVRYCATALRHSHATHQLQTGTDPVTVATLLGHSDTSMLAKVYANLSPEYLAAKARRNDG